MCACEKSRFDMEVKELCAKDGGVRIHETVNFPPEKFDQFGDIRLPTMNSAGPNDDYYEEWIATHLHEGNPSMRRDQFMVVRRADKKVLGEAVSYSRRGGDIPGPWHESSFRCPPNSDDIALRRAIFLKTQ
jgi:hypothetical protein